ncbi:toxin-antitoxin system TumE family protein [Agrobacterium pusense]|uniref:toxin-antitoxin system TumE family protein n=1 Tax=Agrobacterium pusense TaxID=648995 RepID=UPI00296EFB3E
MFKYRLFFGKDGRRIVGFDNERGKGDHCHLDGDEHPYMFTTTDALLSDFRKEIIKRRKRSRRAVRFLTRSSFIFAITE